jgi:tetratricopeptide (TPR) repeat protein
MNRLLPVWILASGLLSAQGAFDLHASASAKVRKGAPLFLDALVTLRQEAAARIELKDGRNWPAALQVRLLDSSGRETPVEWELLGTAEGALQFGDDALEAGALFGLGPDATAQLAAGEYTLTAQLDTGSLAAAGAWAGRAVAPTTRILVLESGAEPSENEAVFEKRCRARWLALHDGREQALALLEEILASNPDHLDVLLDKADLLTGLQRTEEAAAVLNAALARFRAKNPKATHPPREILRRLHAAGAA